MKSALQHLFCPECGPPFDAAQIQTSCPRCDSPLLARYDLEALKGHLTPQTVAQRPPGLWRWAELLPVHKSAYRFTLGEGDPPLLPAPRLGARLGLQPAQRELAQTEGIFAAPEGAATLAALRHLVSQGWIQPHERVVLFNTGSGLKYVALD